MTYRNVANGGSSHGYGQRAQTIDARQSLTSARPSRLRPFTSMHYMHHSSLRPTTHYFSRMPPRHLANIAETRKLNCETSAEQNWLPRQRPLTDGETDLSSPIHSRVLPTLAEHSAKVGPLGVEMIDPGEIVKK